MKTSIIITGEIASKFLLKGLLEQSSLYTRERNFSFEIRYRSKREAILALSRCYQILKMDKKNWRHLSNSYIYKIRLKYDSGLAYII